jgi:glycosyltransferase involved in cell wall biosynthesis
VSFAWLIYNPEQLSCSIMVGDGVTAVRHFRGLDIIEAVNLSLQKAVENNHSWIALIESEMSFGGGTFSELNDLMSMDPMIGFIALHNPSSSESQGRGWEYSVLGNSTVLLVKVNILADMGVLDASFTTVAFAQLDLILRANQFGYRCVRAFSDVLLAKTPTFNRNDWKRLRKKHPRLMAFLRRERQNQKKRQHLKPRSEASIRVVHQPVRSVEFDLTNLRRHHDGTAEVACKMLKAFIMRFGAEFEITLHASEPVLSFHGLDRSSLSQGKSDCSIRFGQIQTSEELLLSMRRAPLLGGVFLDTIALDCMHLDKVNLWQLWHNAFTALDFVLFISEFSRKQASLRFPESVPEISVAQLLSTSVLEYSEFQSKKHQDSDYVFIVGNRFAHKDVRFVAEKIASLTMRNVIALADKTERSGKISYVQSGSLSADDVEELYAKSSLVVFPSHYEGFGFPIMHALANRRPIVCRDLPVYHEIIDRTSQGINVYPCRTRADLIRMVVENPPVWMEPTQQILPVTWLDSAEVLAETIRRAASHRRDDYAKEQIEKTIASQYRPSRFGKNTDRLLQSARKRMDALIAPHAKRLGYL